jgi:nucleotide-binding universal stress UspA family protein
MPEAPVLVGYVDSPEGNAALDAAVEQAKLTSSPMVVVASHKGGASMGSPEAYALEQVLEKVRGRLADSGVSFEVRALVRGNDVSEDLVDLAEQTKARLIVIGLRKRSPVGKLILGSNSQQILLEAPCAVLAVKAT